MQLISLELFNVLKHKHLLVEFEAGLNIIRGANEAGKSSLLEGLGYNWFGASMLEKGLDASVTWGAKKSAFKTISRFIAGDGVEYTCTRGTSGAELVADGEVVVTGQKEVTAKIEELFGLPKGKARQIIFAAQNEIRGILASGPTATAEFIEKLGDFGQADEFIRKLTAKVATGPTKPLQERIERLEAQLKETMEDTVDPTLIENLEKEVEEAARKLEKVANELVRESEDFNRERQRDKEYQERYERLVQTISQLKRERENALAQKQALEAKAQKIPVLEAELKDLAGRAEAYSRWLAYREGVLNAPKCALEWDEPLESLEQEIEQVTKTLAETRDRASEIRGEVQSLKRQFLTPQTCPLGLECPHDNTAEVERKNQELRERIAGLEKEAITLAEKEQELIAEASELKSLVEARERLLDHVARWLSPDDYELDESVVPPRLSWKGPPPQEISEVSSFEVDRANAALREAEEAAKALETFAVPSDDGIRELEAQLAAMKPPFSRKDLEDWEARLFELTQEQRGLEHALQEKQKELRYLLDRVSAGKARRETLESEILTAQDELSYLDYGNWLVKAVKEARLKVTDLLWNQVLSCASGFFSQFRGRPSTLSRGEGGFLIDGQASRPSGSTADVLGLAIRITIAKLFSDCRILVLDEPSAGCDEERTALMTGGLLASGFDQVILVTHKDVDESAGGHLIELD
jgi:exonuclease SbcC